MWEPHAHRHKGGVSRPAWAGSHLLSLPQPSQASLSQAPLTGCPGPRWARYHGWHGGAGSWLSCGHAAADACLPHAWGSSARAPAWVQRSCRVAHRPERVGEGVEEKITRIRRALTVLGMAVPEKALHVQPSSSSSHTEGTRPGAWP